MTQAAKTQSLLKAFTLDLDSVEPSLAGPKRPQV